MENIKKVAEKLGVLPRLKLGVRVVKPDGKSGGIRSTGPHLIKFLAEPALVMGKSFEGKQRQELKFEVEENGVKYHWKVPILNKEGQPNYLIERLMDVQVGDDRILEMRKHGPANYVDIRKTDEAPDEPPEDSEDEEIENDEH